MAKFDFDDIERRRAEEEDEEKRLIKASIKMYGEELGKAFHHHTYETATTHEQENNDTHAFIDAVTGHLTSTNTDLVRLGVDALVRSSKIKIGIAEGRAANAHRRSIHV